MCSCHFQEKKKENDPIIFKRNVEKFFPEENTAKNRKLKVTSTSKACLVPKVDDDKLDNVSLNVDESALMDPCTLYSESVDKLKKSDDDAKTSNKFSLKNLNEEIMRIKTGIPTKKIFSLIANYARRFKDDISYFHGRRWKA